MENIYILLVDNGSSDNSKSIYQSWQLDHPQVKIWWLESGQGKAKALNKGIYSSKGKYIINIDSDGILDKEAIFNIVYNFENDSNIYAQTGVVLIDPDYLMEEKNIGTKLLRNCELFEYCESFIIGRAFESKTNTMFTLAGACSCFRKDALLKTQLYNGETLGEDTHMTSQIREILKGKVILCEDAFFYVDPIENMDKLYIQRQRWQRGEIEVSALFNNYEKKGLGPVLFMSMFKDHTLAFPRLVWMFAMIYFIAIDYPMKLIIGANMIMYLAYVVNSLLYFFVVRGKLKSQKITQKYITRHCYTVLLLPLYRIVLYFIRVAGTINAIEAGAKWNKSTFSQEKKIIKDTVRHKLNFFYRVKRWVNNVQVDH